MLSCREVVERASLLMDGGLSLRERIQMRVHLAMCSHCRRFLRQLRLMAQALAIRYQRSTSAVPDQFVERVVGALAAARVESSPGELRRGPDDAAS